jgi:hypothetical protein
VQQGEGDEAASHRCGPVPNRRFSHVHVGLVGPLPTSAEGFRYLFMLVDRSTWWVEAVPIKTMSAVDCADAFIAAWVSRFGVPANLTSDRGGDVVRPLLCLKLEVSHQMTTAYHPQSNGMVERAHGSSRTRFPPGRGEVAPASTVLWVLLGLRAGRRFGYFFSGAGLWGPSFSTWPVHYSRRSASSWFSGETSVCVAAADQAAYLYRDGGQAAHCPPGGKICLCPAGRRGAALGAALPGSIPGSG